MRRTSRRNTIIAGGWVPLLFATSALQAADPTLELPELVVSASDVYRSLGLATDPLSVPLVGSEISVADLLRRDVRTLKDALDFVPGITVGTGNGVHDFFVVRGIDSLSGGLILMDGVPEPESTFYPLHNLESVEVLKGPGSFAYGAGSLGGSVNLVRKTPRFERFGAIRTRAGTRSRSRVEGDVGAPLAGDSIALRLNGVYENNGSHRDLVESEIIAVNPSVLYRIGDNGSLLMHVDLQRNEVVPDAGVPVLQDQLFSGSRSLTFQVPDDDSTQDVFRFYSRYDHILSDRDFVRNQLYFSMLDWETEGTVYAGFVRFGLGLEPAPETLSRFRPRLDDRQRNFGNELTLHLRRDTGSIPHDLQLGLEYARFTDEFTLIIPPTTDISVRTRETSPGPLQPLPDNAGDATSDIYSLYLLDQANVAAGWTMLAGLRGDWLEFEDQVRGTDRSDRQLSPLAGVVYRPREELSFFVNGGRGFAPPSTQVVGPRGQPEESTQLEGGMKWNAAEGRWAGQISGYYLERTNIGIPDSFGILTDRGDQTSHGVEVELEGRPAEMLAVYLAYGFLDSELTSFTETTGSAVLERSGNTAPFSPEHTLAAWIDWSPMERWTLGLGLRHVGDHFIAPDNAFQIEATTRVDASLTYRQERWNASLHLRNLTDEDIYTRGQGGTSVIPEDGVSAAGSIGVRW